MRALFVRRYGGREAMELGEQPRTEIGPDDVLVAVLAHLGELARAGRIVPVIDKIYPLEQFAEAFAYAESGRVTGKVILKIS
jgi:NADPH:quinone reductase-like Zn-dependent oxidoreductase